MNRSFKKPKKLIKNLNKARNIYKSDKKKLQNNLISINDAKFKQIYK